MANRIDLEKRCPICKLDRFHESMASGGWGFHYRCACCGKFDITEEAVWECTGSRASNLHLLSAFLRHYANDNQTRFKVMSEHVRDPVTSLGLYERPVVERLFQTLAILADKAVEFGAEIPLEPQVDWPLVWSSGSEEFNRLINQQVRAGLVEAVPNGPGLPPEYRTLKLTADGWKAVEENRRQNPVNGKSVFVAMSFSSELLPAWLEGFEPGIRATGFEAKRIDRKEFNDKICDEIIAEIRACRLVVADFTGQKGGVYFEAGFALGLGKPVIWTCREDDMENLHFDTRQYNHIVWTDPADLKAKLTHRINATVQR